jgi:hypothetical protein
MTFRDSPMAEQTAANEKDMVIHARFTVGDFTIMGSDAPGGRYSKPGGYAVSIGGIPPRKPSASSRRKCRHADRGDLLGQTLRNAHRQVRHAVHG